MNMNDFQILKTFLTRNRTEFSIATKPPQNKSFLLKTISGKQIPSHLRQRFHDEFKLAGTEKSPDIMQPANLIDTETVVGLAYPDPHLIPLSMAVKAEAPSLLSALETTLKIAKALSRLHARDCIHYDISPETIWIDPQGEQLKLMGPGRPAGQPPHGGEVHSMDFWLYKSPEQAGRLHTAMDWRTDFYSLGALLFFMICGAPPFRGKDALELIHNHMARPVPAPHRADTPTMVIRLVEKLMEKSPENRYRSAHSLVVDLTRCITALEKDGTIADFRLDVLERSHIFEYPEELFGRDEAMNQLLLSFDRVNPHHEVLTMVTGGSGVGKTSLVRHFKEKLPPDQGYFVSGKCQCAAAAIPYSGILGALERMARCILMEADEAYVRISQDLTRALGENIGVVTQLVPQFRPILGEVDPVSHVQALESRNRLHQCVFKILTTLCKHKAFLVIFIDDLQWADQASLDLIRNLLNRRPGKLFFIGAFRNNEVSSSHPLGKTLAGIDHFRASVDTLALRDLARPDIEEILQAALKLEQKDIAALAGVTHRKTNGTPLLVKEFIELLVRENYLSLNRRMAWEFDLEQITAIPVNKDIDLLACRKLGRLPRAVRHTISIAAAIGNAFHARDLILHDASDAQTIEGHLRSACRKNVLVSMGKGRYRFEHDRLQENAYKMIPEETRKRIHLSLGKSFEREAADNKHRIFKHINHLNSARHLADTHKEKRHLARLNLIAGQQAKKVAAFTEALQYFSMGLDILGETAWEEHYALSLDLHAQGAAAAYLCGSFDTSHALSGAVIQRGKTDIDRIPGYEARIDAAIFQNRIDEALTTLLSALATLGIQLDLNTTIPQARADILRLKPAAEKLLETPCARIRQSTHPRYQTIMRLLLQGAKATGWIDYPLYWSMVGKMLAITQSHGFFEESVFGLIASGGTFCHLLEEYELGIQLAEYGRDYMESYQIRKWTLDARIYLHEEVTCLKERPQVAVDHLTTAYYQAVETGNVSMAVESAHAACLIGLFGNMPLAELEQLSLKFEEILSVSFPGVTPLQSNLKMLNSVVQSLLSPQPPDTALLDQNAFRSNRELTLNIRLFLDILMGDAQAALDHALELLPYGCNFVMIPTRFYLLLALMDQPHPPRGEVARLKDEFMALVRVSKDNHAHRHHLILAEEHRIKAEYQNALGHYDQALSHARENKFSLDQALALELTARCLDQMGAGQMARSHLSQAHDAYQNWGSRAKVFQMEQAHAFLSGRPPLPVRPETGVPTPLPAQPASTMDMGSIHRAVVTLVSAMDGLSLLKELMGILLQNSGAERGYLLSQRQDALVIECSVSIDETAPQLPPGTPIESCEQISHSIARYVCRTNHTFLSSDLTQDIQFGRTEYAKTTGLKSVLNMPVTYQDETVAFLYLENQHIQDTFTRERFPVIQLLASQIAAAIERTRLHRELLQEIENRKTKETELRSALERLSKLKNSLNEENEYLKEEIRNNHGFKDIIGQSPALKKTLYLVEQVVAFDTTTLILGESGTGKELIARSIHDLGPRKDHPIIKVNCAALPATLIESELFGFEKGAFTGAVKPKKGRFLLADGGTLFLDEIGDMPLEVQAKLLRVLQEGTFEPLGSDKTLKVDVRVVAATNRDLEQAVREGSFREDLYYRLSIFPIQVPPLRQRKEDIPLLVNYFMDKKNKALNKNIKKIPTRTLNALTAYDWPGNIRELENTMERALILSPGTTLVLDEGFSGQTALPQPSGETNLDQAIKAHIRQVLDQCNGKVKGKGNAAEMLGINPSTLRSKMKKLGISAAATPQD